MTILIVTPTLVDNDAIANDIIKQSYYLSQAGYQVMVYTSNNLLNHQEELAIIPKKELLRLVSEKQNFLLFHHSMYWQEGEEILAKSRCRKALKYHNITPSKFFKNYSDPYYQATDKGVEQTKKLINGNYFDLLSADSDFNRQDLLEYAKDSKNLKVSVIPPFTKLDDFHSVKLNTHLVQNRLSTAKIKILFVGRFAPNKGIHHLIRVINAYRDYIDDQIILSIVGNIDPQLSLYQKEIVQFIEQNQLDDHIEILGKLSFQDLVTYYKTSDLFLICSEHEGFCVPILEAQKTKLPIISYLSSAIEDTLGKDQLGFTSLDYLKLATAIRTVSSNSKTKLFLGNAGQKNLERFQDGVILKKLLTLVDDPVNN